MWGELGGKNPCPSWNLHARIQFKSLNEIYKIREDLKECRKLAREGQRDNDILSEGQKGVSEGDRQQSWRRAGQALSLEGEFLRGWKEW